MVKILTTKLKNTIRFQQIWKLLYKAKQMRKQTLKVDILIKNLVLFFFLENETSKIEEKL